jgi:DNA-binding response OmpR family regulator
VKILIAEDDTIIRRLLEVTLSRSGYEVAAVSNGRQALEEILQPDGPRLAVLDWMMPEIDGLDVCRRVRGSANAPYVYMLVLTAKGRKEDLLEGLDAGADDFLTKPFDPQELRSRLRVGRRLLDLEAALRARVGELQEALDQVEQLQGLLPICMHCKKIRDEENRWQRVETYIAQRSAAEFTHALCEECRERHYPRVPTR